MKKLRQIFKSILNLYSKVKYRKYIGTDTLVHYRSFIDGEVKIGKHTNINGRAYLKGNISIGNWCAIANEFVARSKNHYVCYPNMQAKLNMRYGFKQVHDFEKGRIFIGNGVWIGDRVTVLSGVKIGNGAIVGAGSIVTKDLEPFSINAGSPAKLIKYRFNKDIIKVLDTICWWDWSESKIAKNKEFFELDLNSVTCSTQIINIIKD